MKRLTTSVSEEWMMLKTLFVSITISLCLASDVIELNDDNFDRITRNNKFIVVQFYTNW